MHFKFKDIVKDSRLFWKTVLSYILLIMLFMFVQTGVFSWMYKNMEDEMENTGRDMIKSIKQIIDTDTD